MMTPLVMDYPQDENTYQLTRQYMFGQMCIRDSNKANQLADYTIDLNGSQSTIGNVWKKSLFVIKCL